LSFLIRQELKRSNKKMTGHLYNVVITSHGLIIIFFMLIPTLIGGFGNYFIPLILGGPDLIFARINNLSL